MWFMLVFTCTQRVIDDWACCDNMHAQIVLKIVCFVKINFDNRLQKINLTTNRDNKGSETAAIIGRKLCVNVHRALLIGPLSEKLPEINLQKVATGKCTTPLNGLFRMLSRTVLDQPSQVVCKVMFCVVAIDKQTSCSLLDG